MRSLSVHPLRLPGIRVGSWVDENTDFSVLQLSNEEVGFSRSRERKFQVFVQIGFGEYLVFGFGLEAEQSRHDVRTLNVNHESDLSLYVRIIFGNHEYESSRRSEGVTYPFHFLEPMPNLPLDLAIKQSAEQRNLGARAHLGPLAEGNMKSDDILDHGPRFEFVKCTCRELDAETGQESTSVDRGNDSRSDSSAVSQPVQVWSSLNVERISGDEPTESRGFGTANHLLP